MRILKMLLILVSLIALTECSGGDDTTFSYELVPIKNVTIPEEFNKGKTHTITVYYQQPTSCHSFIGFDTNNLSRNEQAISIINLVVNKDDCKTFDTTQLAEASFEFFSDNEKVYIFKFWQGKKENGDNKFLIIEIPVV